MSAWRSGVNGLQVLGENGYLKGRCLRERCELKGLLYSSLCCLLYTSLLAKVERLEPPPLLAYLDAHLNEERYYEEWQKIFLDVYKRQIQSIEYEIITKEGGTITLDVV